MSGLPTRRLAALERRIKKLDSTFLPPLRTTGDYSDDEYDQVRAYVVLTHAEIEHFVEEWAEEILNAARARWQTSKRAGRCAAALMMYAKKKIESPRSLSAQNSNENFESHLIRLARNHSGYISQENHGIKEKNLLAIYLPIGLLEDDFDPVWLGTMNSYGTQRGIVAHNAARVVKTPPDPATVRAMVVDIIAGLRALEPTLKRLKLS